MLERALVLMGCAIGAGLALIAVVGRGMKSASGTAGKLFTALATLWKY